MTDDRNLMGVLQSISDGLFALLDKDLDFPQPIGPMDVETIIIFFSVCSILAYMVRSIGERRE